MLEASIHKETPKNPLEQKNHRASTRLLQNLEALQQAKGERM